MRKLVHALLTSHGPELTLSGPGGGGGGES